MEPLKRVTLVYAVFSMAVVFIDPVFSIYLSQQGHSAVWLTILLSSFTIGMFFTAPLIGGLSDNWGRRPLILIGLLLEVVALLSYIYLSHPIIIFLARILEAIGYACVALVAVAKLEDLVSIEKKTANSKIGISLSIGKIGHIFGPLIGGVLATYYGITAPFFGSIAVIGILGFWYLFEKHNVHPKPPLEKLTLNPIPGIRELWKTKELRGMNIFAIVHQYSIPVLFVFLPIHIIQNMNLGFEHVGIALFASQLPLALQFYGGKLVDQHGSKKVMIWGNTLCGLALLTMAIIQTYDWLLVALFLYGMGTSALGISMISALSGIAQEKRKEGAFLGAHISISKIGTFTGFITAGIIVQLSSIYTLFLVSGVVILIGIIATEEWVDHSFELPSPKRMASALFRYR